MRYAFILLLITINFCNAAVPTTPSSLSLPRFASLRAKTVNLHVGPGSNYPTEWTFVRQGLPVEIIAEFDTWRQIRDWQGTQGWVHKSLLCGKRTAVIQQKQRKLHKEPDENTSVIAHIEPGVLGKLMECRNDWCRLDIQGHKGWIKRRYIWGVYPHEDKFK
jgi:SH3-like domain-containing protein